MDAGNRTDARVTSILLDGKRHRTCFQSLWRDLARAMRPMAVANRWPGLPGRRTADEFPAVAMILRED